MRGLLMVRKLAISLGCFCLCFLGGSVSVAQDKPNDMPQVVSGVELQQIDAVPRPLSYVDVLPVFDAADNAQVIAQYLPSDDMTAGNRAMPIGSDSRENEENGVVIMEEAASDMLNSDGRDFGSKIVDHIELKDMEIVDVLKLLAQKSGLNIIAGKNIQGKVSIYLKDVKLIDALRIVLDSNDLAYKEENGIIRVMTANEFEKRYGHVFGGRFETRVFHLTYASAQEVSAVIDQIKSPGGKVVVDEASNTLVIVDTDEKLGMITSLLDEVDVPVEVQVFDLNYAVAKDIVEKIEPVLTKGIGRVEFDERSNKIIVTDIAEKIEKAQEIVEAFDVKEQQVLIEAKIVQIELTDDYELGVDWKAIFAGLDTNIDIELDVISTTAGTNQGQITVGALADDGYNIILDALRQIGNTNILSSPSIMALNNQEAKILVGTTEPYVTSTTTTSSTVATTADSVNFVDVGVKLYVTSTIHKDHFITMKVRPEVSSVNDYLEVGSEGNKIPIVKTSEAETSVRIKDGATIVIGGLIEENASDIRQKVPLLGDLPLIGAAFRNRDTAVTKTEIAIFLTPTIISGEESLTPNFDDYMDMDLQ